MKWWELVKAALEAIADNKLRSGLTMLGIIIGVMAVIIVVTVGQAGKMAIMKEFESIGSNIFAVYVSQPEEGSFEQYKMTLEDCRAVRNAVDSVRYLVPVAASSARVRSRLVAKQASIIGTEAEYAEFHNVVMIRGRFFNQTDCDVSRRVIVISEGLADDLFGAGGDAVGQKVVVGQTPMTICGVCKNQSSMFNIGQNQRMAYIPIKAYFSAFNDNGVWQLDGCAKDQDRVTATADQVLRVLKNRHNTDDEKAYMVINMEKELEAANRGFNILTMVIGVIAGISLLVGGIGIMNIMLVSVTERTHEIGVRMAVGARREDILVQFLIESAVLSAVGGTIGIILGLVGAAVLCRVLNGLPFVVSVPTILISFGFSMIVGVFFGLYPANRAARLNPIDALRYE